jgi:predicted nucleotidyltransferase
MARDQDIKARLNDFIEALQRRLRVTSIVLIGSRARGDALETSDVDLLIVSDDFEGMPYLERLHEATQDWMPSPSLEVFAHTEAEVRKRSKTLTLHILEALDRGVILFDTGFFEALRKEFKAEMRQGRVIRYRYGYAFA